MSQKLSHVLQITQVLYSSISLRKYTKKSREKKKHLFQKFLNENVYKLLEILQFN